MMKFLITWLLIAGTCVYVDCQAKKTLTFTISGRNLPNGKKLFYDVGKGWYNSERIQNSQNPDWQKTGNVDYTGDKSQFLQVEVRHDRWWWPDDSIGWGMVYVKNMLEEGKTIQESIWSGDRRVYKGYIRITTSKVTTSDSIDSQIPI